MFKEIIKLNKSSDIIQKLIYNYNSHLYSNEFRDIIIYPSVLSTRYSPLKKIRLHGVDNGLVELVLHSVKILVEITFQRI